MRHAELVVNVWIAARDVGHQEAGSVDVLPDVVDDRCRREDIVGLHYLQISRLKSGLHVILVDAEERLTERHKNKAQVILDGEAAALKNRAETHQPGLPLRLLYPPLP